MPLTTSIQNLSHSTAAITPVMLGALDLELLKAENNHVIRLWQAAGIEVESAADSQAILQLQKEYCDKKDCLRCRFGYEYLKHK